MKNEADCAEFEKSPQKRFEFLDGLRGIAALLVVLYHFNNRLKESALAPFPKLIDLFFSLGEWGVELFFVLSGFVIAYSIQNQVLSFPFITNFFIRRSIRLDPPYWIIICLLVLSSLIGNFFKATPAPIPSFTDISINLFYLFDFLSIPRILPVAWTLALEIQFYLFLILLVKSLQFIDSKFPPYCNGSPLSFPSLALLSFLMLLSLLQTYSWPPNIPGLFLGKWSSFFIGSLACWTMLKVIKPVFFWINLGFIAVYASLGNSFAIGTCFISLSIYGVIKNGMMHTLLKGAVFQYLGKISYSLYLIHWVIGIKFMDFMIRLFGNHIENTLQASALIAVTLILTLLASHVFYQLIELPTLRLSHKFKKAKKIDPAFASG